MPTPSQPKPSFIAFAQRLRLLRGEVDVMSIDDIRARLESLAVEAESAAAVAGSEPEACAEGHPI